MRSETSGGSDPRKPRPEVLTATWLAVAVVDLVIGGVGIVLGGFSVFEDRSDLSRLGHVLWGLLAVVIGGSLIAAATERWSVGVTARRLTGWGGFAQIAVGGYAWLALPNLLSLIGLLLLPLGAIGALASVVLVWDHRQNSSGARRIGLRLLGGLGTLLACLALLAVMAVAVLPDTDGLVSQPRPAANYDEALAMFATATADEGSDIYDPCRSSLRTHGEQTDVVVMFFHGLTNCPRQFGELADLAFQRGANTLVLRAPRHGLVNSDATGVRGVGAAGGLSADELRAHADTAIDIAAGLGAEVRVLGLSMGGVQSTWAAQHRSEIARAVHISPALTLSGSPPIVDRGLVGVLSRLPNFTTGTGVESVDHIYSGSASRAVAAVYLLGRETREDAHSTPPATPEMIVITNGFDDSVDNRDIDDLADDWMETGADVTQYRLPAELKLPHDVIDVGKEGADTDLIYPILLAFLDGEDPPQLD
ncbi:MAG: alpha/beta hydrolase [Acidimicrobiales bacterium]